MGKSTINHHFQWLFVCLPEGTWWHGWSPMEASPNARQPSAGVASCRKRCCRSASRAHKTWGMAWVPREGAPLPRILLVFGTSWHIYPMHILKSNSQTPYVRPVPTYVYIYNPLYTPDQPSAISYACILPIYYLHAIYLLSMRYLHRAYILSNLNTT